MAKNYKKLTKAGLAAALVTSAIVPVASAATPAAAEEVSYVIIDQDGKLVKISIEDYSTLLGGGQNPTVKYITLTNEETFTIDQFSEVLGATLELGATLTYLANNSEPTAPSNVSEGSIVDGELVVEDETPEENSNETFFYNLAA
ncbi:ABC-type polar amino acid transport system, ATPase component [Solibacillus silvestris StLB046]|uniref:ABC-type polar amino acid transport system, ATPase component n=1 Tax=Solibacillus silvestris (strain StLB046) TaxID=1002809 RepID=F2F3X3_SOLSS|nr:hypothetical protein [Solibacillus silvestris]BAK17771.1 ABC-type polar amino acid transport system, ATPase component [Solibacillus silvestris StLB046]